MGVTNLGRVQGAGFFYTTASSGTSVALSTITPTSIKPLVGDCVIFPNGDLRKVTAVSSTTVTCGSVLASFKGGGGSGGGNSSVANTYIEGEGDVYTLFGSTETGICEVFGTIDCNSAQEDDYSIEIETDSGNNIAYVADVFHGDMDGRGRVYFYAKIIRLLNYSTTYTQTTFRHVASDTAGTVTEQTNIHGTANAGGIYIYFGASASYTMNMVIVKTTEV